MDLDKIKNYVENKLAQIFNDINDGELDSAKEGITKLMHYKWEGE